MHGWLCPSFRLANAAHSGTRDDCRAPMRQSPRQLDAFPGYAGNLFWTATGRRGAGLDGEAYRLSFGPEGQVPAARRACLREAGPLRKVAAGAKWAGRREHVVLGRQSRRRRRDTRGRVARRISDLSIRVRGQRWSTWTTQRPPRSPVRSSMRCRASMPAITPTSIAAYTP